MKAKNRAEAYAVGLHVATIALGLQIAPWLVVLISELVGATAAERTLLRAIEFIYLPAVTLYFEITPAAWHMLGNVMDGLLALVFGIAAYTVVAGVVGMTWAFARARRMRAY